MKTAEAVWPTNRTPNKAQIERMYRLAYTLDSSFFRANDLVDFGLDLPRLKEFGKVRMSKSLGQMRRHVHSLWERMDANQRGAFILSYLWDTLGGVDALVGDLEKEVGEMKEVRDALTWLQGGIFGRFPQSLQKQLQRGLERWGNGST